MGFKAPKGTYDVLPEKAEKWEFLEEIARDIFKSYGYRPITTPAFESTELFARGIGEATDIVQKEMYTFEDKGKRSLTLRPEGTAPIVRAYVEHNMNQLLQPVKLYYTGSMFRYERPQAGRYRQFYQMGVEAIGSDDPAIDAEVIELFVDYLDLIGISEVNLLIGSMGCPKCRPAYAEALRESAGNKVDSLCGDCAKRLDINPLRLLDCKVPGCREAMADAPKLIDFLCDECRNHFDAVRGYLDRVGIEYTVNSSLVRGLDYYTKTTFEVQSASLGAQNAIGGGGRYDKLVEELGGKPTSAIGFAIGMERLAMAVEAEAGSIPVGHELDAFIVTIEESAKVEAFAIAGRLRHEGFSVEMDFAGRNVKGQTKAANKLGAKYALFIGPDELAKGVCQLKDMESGEQEEVELDAVPDYLGDRIFGELGEADANDD